MPRDNEFGHASIATNKYHISLWPFLEIKIGTSNVSIANTCCD